MFVGEAQPNIAINLYKTLVQCKFGAVIIFGKIDFKFSYERHLFYVVLGNIDVQTLSILLLQDSTA